MASTSDARDKTLRLYNALRDQSPSVLTPEAVRAIAQPLGFSDQAIRESLARLADRDLLMRMSRGRYVFTDAPGAPRVHPFLVATTSVTPSAISHWSALQHWHLTEQIPQQVFITSPRRGMRTPHQTSHQRTTEPEADHSHRSVMSESSLLRRHTSLALLRNGLLNETACRSLMPSARSLISFSTSTSLALSVPPSKSWNNTTRISTLNGLPTMQCSLASKL